MKTIIRYSLLIVFIFTSLFFTGCGAEDTWARLMESGTGVHVFYNANGATAGTVPVDENWYGPEDTVVVLGNSGDMVLLHFIFAGWINNATGVTFNESDTFTLSGSDVTLTAVQGPGNLVLTDNYFTGWSDGTYLYQQGETFLISNTAVTLTAVWVPVLSALTLTYYANFPVPESNGTGNTPANALYYTLGQTVTVLGNTALVPLAYPAYFFNGWNTAADGTGTDYSANQTFIINADTGLYAKWIDSAAVSYRLTYYDNNSDIGAVPVDNTFYISGDTAVILENYGNLARAGYTFSGWNTSADGSGTNYAPGSQVVVSSNIALYANWQLQVMVSTDFSTGIDANFFVTTSGISLSSGTVLIPDGESIKSRMFKIPAIIEGVATITDSSPADSFNHFCVLRNPDIYNKHVLPNGFYFSTELNSANIITDVVEHLEDNSLVSHPETGTFDDGSEYRYRLELYSNKQIFTITNTATLEVYTRETQFPLKSSVLWYFQVAGNGNTVPHELDSISIQTIEQGELP